MVSNNHDAPNWSLRQMSRRSSPHGGGCSAGNLDTLFRWGKRSTEGAASRKTRTNREQQRATPRPGKAKGFYPSPANPGFHQRPSKQHPSENMPDLRAVASTNARTGREITLGRPGPFGNEARTAVAASKGIG